MSKYWQREEKERKKKVEFFFLHILAIHQRPAPALLNGNGHVVDETYLKRRFNNVDTIYSIHHRSMLLNIQVFRAKVYRLKCTLAVSLLWKRNKKLTSLMFEQKVVVNKSFPSAKCFPMRAHLIHFSTESSFEFQQYFALHRLCSSYWSDIHIMANAIHSLAIGSQYFLCVCVIVHARAFICMCFHVYVFAWTNEA